MKVLAFALILAAGQSFADVPEITAKHTTCAQLKEAVKNYGTVTIVKKFLGIKKRYTVHQSEECSSDERKERGVFKTVDEKHCMAGEWCEYIPTYSSSDYSSSDSYDSGSSWSGSSYDYGSSGSSGSSSSSGSSYNPPSSGDRGSSYNPPSSGTRGSRYCPGC